MSLPTRAKNDIRAITKRIPLNVLAAIHRLSEYGSGRVKSLNDEEDNRLRVGDFCVRFTEVVLIPCAFTR